MTDGSVTRVVGVGLGVAGVVCLLALGAILVAPDLVIDETAAGLEGDAAKLEKARNDVRTAAIQFLGVVGLAVGAYFTLRTIRVTQKGQLVDRFTKAVDQLGNKDA